MNVNRKERGSQKLGHAGFLKNKAIISDYVSQNFLETVRVFRDSAYPVEGRRANQAHYKLAGRFYVLQIGRHPTEDTFANHVIKVVLFFKMPWL